MTHTDRAKQYCEDVIAGRVLACKLLKLACQRHLRDLKRQKHKAFPFRFDDDAANRVCAYVELLPHTKGLWASKGLNLTLEDWQCFIVCVPFGWLRKKGGKRRYRRVYYEIPRKDAKSTITAAVGDYMFTADGEFGAEVYSGAASEKQAWEVFGPARLMAKNTPALLAKFGVEINAKNMNILEKASKFEPLIGNPGDGASPSFAIIDEYHEHATEHQYDTMLTGMGAREQPMIWAITTAGSDTAGPCYALRSEVVAVLNGTVENDELWGVIWTIDEGTDWTSEEALIMANPNYNVSVFGDYLKVQQRDAVNNPRKQATFKMKHLNIWLGAAAPFFNLEKWNRLGDSELKVEDFKGEPCWIGLDLASKLDITATMKLFCQDEDGAEHYYAFGRYYIPEERTQDPSLRHYDGWVKGGYLITTPGNITDYDEIEADIIDDAEKYRIVQLGFDPWNATQIATHLGNEGIECVEIPQTTKNLSDPMKWIEALIEDGRIHHDGNPLMSWMMGNVTAKIDRNDNVFPRKERAENKIDGAVALMIAKGREGDSEEGEPWDYKVMVL